MLFRNALHLWAVLWLLTSWPACRADAKDALPSPKIPAGQLNVGVNIGWRPGINFTGAPPARDLEGLARGGFGWIRMDFSWSGIEHEKGSYDFAAYDKVLAGLTAHHIKPLFILDYGAGTASIDARYQRGAPRTPQERAAFVKFAMASVRHYRGKPILWEIWNEPNGPHFWHPRPDASEYGRLAVETARGIKEADPSATMLAPGTSEIPLSYIETCFQMGMLRYIDAVSVHPYRKNAPETAAPEYQQLRQLIARHAPRGKTIALVSSEWGYSAGEVSEETQAQYLARQWLFNLAEGVRLSIWYDWYEYGQNPKDAENRYGTVRWDYTPKPAFLAAQTLIRTLRGYRFIRRIPLASQDDYLLLFSQGHGGVKLAAWTTASAHQILLPISGIPTITTMLGAKSPMSAAGDGRISLNLSGSPEYLAIPRQENVRDLRPVGGDLADVFAVPTKT